MRRSLLRLNRQRAFLRAITVIVLALALVPRTVGAAGTLDQSFLPTATNVAGEFCVNDADHRAETGQTFTAGITGTLTQVDVYLDKNIQNAPGTGPLHVQIQTLASNGAPSGTILGSADVPASAVPLNTPGWVSVPISAPSVAGNHYAIVLANDDPQTNYCVPNSQPNVPLYQGGQLWFFVTVNGASHWETNVGSPNDSFFRTYVTASPTITASANPSTIWPPNHKAVPVTVTVQVTAGGAPLSTPAFVLTNVQVRGGSASDITGFIIGQPSVRGTVQANKDEAYTLTYTATDQAGNSATATVTITVPHDQGRGGGALQAAPMSRLTGGVPSGAASGAGSANTAPAPVPTGR